MLGFILKVYRLALSLLAITLTIGGGVLGVIVANSRFYEGDATTFIGAIVGGAIGLLISIFIIAPCAVFFEIHEQLLKVNSAEIGLLERLDSANKGLQSIIDEIKQVSLKLDTLKSNP